MAGFRQLQLLTATIQAVFAKPMHAMLYKPETLLASRDRQCLPTSRASIQAISCDRADGVLFLVQEVSLGP